MTRKTDRLGTGRHQEERDGEKSKRKDCEQKKGLEIFHPWTCTKWKEEEENEKGVRKRRR